MSCTSSVRNVVATLVPLFLPVTTCIENWMSLNFGQMSLLTTELAALEGLKIQALLLWPL